MPKDYEPTAEDMARARALVAAVDIAEKIRSTLASTPELLLESYASVKQAALTPELWGPDSMTTSAEGLIGLERLFLNYWNTVSGESYRRKLVTDRIGKAAYRGVCLTTSLLHRRSDMPCRTITLSG